MTLPSDDEAVLAANERIPRVGIFSGLRIIQSWRCRCGDTAGGHLGDAPPPPGWKQVRCGFAGQVWLCPACQADRSQRAREGAATRARRKRGELWQNPTPYNGTTCLPTQPSSISLVSVIDLICCDGFWQEGAFVHTDRCRRVR